jgi:hypothetical protein
MTIQSRFWVDSGDMYLISRAQAVLTRSPKKWWGADLPALTDSNRPPPTAFQIFYSQGAGIGRAHNFDQVSAPINPHTPHYSVRSVLENRSPLCGSRGANT